jgi:histone deacetylase 6
MQRLEQVVKQKEELAEGLHLIDFEQLKIENQALNEKIEERNEEVLKLKKKITTTAQVVYHGHAHVSACGWLYRSLVEY